MLRPVRVLLLVTALLLVGTGPATAAPAVPAPTITRAEALSDTSVRVAWSPVDRATSYELRWSLYGSVVGSVASTATTATFTSTSSSTYLVEVRALRSTKASAWSPAVPVSTPPAAPTGVTATPLRPDLVELRWDRDLSTLTHAVYAVQPDGSLAGPLARTEQGGVDAVTLATTAATTTSWVVVATGQDGLSSAPSAPATATTPDRWTSEVLVLVYGPFDEGAVAPTLAVQQRPDDPGQPTGTFTVSAPGMATVTDDVGGEPPTLPLPAGTHDVTVAYSGDGAYLPSSTVARIEVRPAVTAFGPAEALGAAGSPVEAAVADVTGDRVVDVVGTVATDDGTGRLALWRGTGGGTFAEPVLTALPGGGSLALGDLDRDGDADAVVAATTGLVVVPGGTAGFGTPSTKRVTGTPVDVAVGDVTADGLADVVLSSTAGLQVLPGNGRAGWGKAVTVSTATATSLALGDTTGDGRPEIAAWTGAVEVWTRAGTAWTPLLRDDAVENDGGLALGDVTGDGRADLVWSTYPSDGSWNQQLRLRVSQGSSFAGARDLPRSYTEQGPAVGDLTGDGRDDVVSGAAGYDWLSVWRVGADGSATPPARVEVGRALSTQQLLVTDLDGDGRDDVLHVGYDGLLVLRRA